MNQIQAVLFSANWGVYQKIIESNYMLHKEFAAFTAQIFESADTGKTIQVLDMGCGDAQLIARQLHLQQSVEYTGYDLSEAALEFASGFLTATKHPFTLRQGLMEELIKEDSAGYDIIYSSYAVHHLQDDAKQELLRNCFDKLHTNGKFILIDVFRTQEQSREEYIASYISWMNACWPAITAEEKALIIEHIQQYDFPPLYNEVIKWALKTGFTVRPFHADDSRHKMLVFQKK